MHSLHQRRYDLSPGQQKLVAARLEAVQAAQAQLNLVLSTILADYGQAQVEVASDDKGLYLNVTPIPEGLDVESPT